MSPRKIDLPDGPPPPPSRSMVSGRRKKQGHSHRWCETCRLYVEWIRWAKTEPSGLTIFLWTEYRKHRQAMP